MKKTRSAVALLVALSIIGVAPGLPCYQAAAAALSAPTGRAVPSNVATNAAGSLLSRTAAATFPLITAAFTLGSPTLTTPQTPLPFKPALKAAVGPGEQGALVPSALIAKPVVAPAANENKQTAFEGLSLPAMDTKGMNESGSKDAAASDFSARIGMGKFNANGDLPTPIMTPSGDNLSGLSASTNKASVYKNFVPATRKVRELQKLLLKDKAAGIKSAIEIIKDEQEGRVEVRLAAMRLLADASLPDAFAAFSAYLETAETPKAKLMKDLGKDKNWYVQREMLKIIGKNAEQAAVAGQKTAMLGRLKAAYSDRNPSVRLMAGWAMRRYGVDPGPEPVVKDPNEIVLPPSARPENSFQQDTRKPNSNGPKKSNFWRNFMIGGVVLALGWMVFANNPSSNQPVKEPTAIVQVDTAKKAADSAIVKVTPPVEKSAADSAATLQDMQKDIKRMADASEKTAKAFEKMSTPKPATAGDGLMSVLRMLLPIALMVGVSIWLFKRMGGGGGAMGQAGKMTQASAAIEKPKTRFTDVAGIDETLVEVQEIMEFLRNPGRFKKMGARIPKGVLLEGPPGTGKTLLARALAGETDASFISMSGSDFIEMFVGVGAARVRSLFQQAHANAPAIIFIDEIDAVGKARGGNSPSGSNSEHEQTINALLAAMDGFDNSSGVIVVAATNRADVLDPALVRPGRFDRKIYVGQPEVMGREAILALHAKKSRLGPDVNLQFVAQRTSGLSGAYLENIVNEAALLAARQDLDAVSLDNVDEAVDRATIGQKRSLHLPEDLKKKIAYHESGHVLANLLGMRPSPVNKVTIIPHGSGALGFAESGSEEGDKYLYERDELEARMDMAMGGLVAENMIYGKWSTGPGSDLEQADRIARMMVERLGMSEKVGLGIAVSQNAFGPRKISEETARIIDEEVRKILDASRKRAEKILTDNRDKLEKMVAALMVKETLTRDEIEEIVNSPKAPPAAAK